MSAQVYPEALPKRGTLAYLEAFPNEMLTMSLDEYWENELKNEYKSEFYKNKVTMKISGYMILLKVRDSL